MSPRRLKRRPKVLDFTMSGTQNIVLGAEEGVSGGSVVVSLHLDEPSTQLQVRDPRPLGRAQVQFGGKRWGAKHYWAQGIGEERLTIFEFDEPLPAGPIHLVVPIE